MLINDIGFGKGRNTTGFIHFSLILSTTMSGGFVSVPSCLVFTQIDGLETIVYFLIYVLLNVVRSLSDDKIS